MQLFRDIKESVGFDEQDVEHLQNLRPAVEPHFDRLVDCFDTALEPEIEADHTPACRREREQLRQALRERLQDGFGGAFGNDYCEAQRDIGSMLEALGIEPEYLLGATNVMRCEFVEILADADLEMPLRDAIVSVERLLDLNTALMLDTYWGSLVAEREKVGAELASFMAHEIRNPLNAVELNMTLLERRLADAFDDSEEYLPMLEAIRSELNRIEGLTREIKQFAQPVSVEPSWHEMNGIVEELERSHAELFDAAEIRFDTEIPEETRVYCDADRIKQLVVNLLQNSVEAIDGGGEIVLSTEKTPEHTTLTIVDTGRGIDLDSSNRLFELFYTTKASGTGLGLAIAKKIVEAHDGSIDLRSNQFGGTTVDIVLPRPDSTESEE